MGRNEKRLEAGKYSKIIGAIASVIIIVFIQVCISFVYRISFNNKISIASLSQTEISNEINNVINNNERGMRTLGSTISSYTIDEIKESDCVYNSIIKFYSQKNNKCSEYVTNIHIFNIEDDYDYSFNNDFFTEYTDNELLDLFDFEDSNYAFTPIYYDREKMEIYQLYGYVMPNDYILVFECDLSSLRAILEKLYSVSDRGLHIISNDKDFIEIIGAEEKYLKHVIIPDDNIRRDIINNGFDTYEDFYNEASGHVYISSTRVYNDVCLLSFISARTLLDDGYMAIVWFLFTIEIFSILIVGHTIASHTRVKLLVKRITRRDKFVADAVEQFKKPLSSILVSSNHGKDSTNEDEDRERFENIKRWAGEISSTIQNLSTFNSKVNERDNLKKIISDNTKKRKTRIITLVIIYISCFISLIFVIVGSSAGMNERAFKQTRGQALRTQEYFDNKTFEIELIANMFSSKEDIIASKNNLEKSFSSLINNVEGIKNLYLATSDNELICSDMTLDMHDYDFFHEEWFIKATKENGGIALTVYEKEGMFGYPCLTFSKVIYDNHGAYLGVIAFDTDLDNLSIILSNLSGSKAYSYLVDDDGFVSFHPNEEYMANGGSKYYYSDIKGSVNLTNYKRTPTTDYNNKPSVVFSYPIGNMNYTIVSVYDYFNLYTQVFVYVIIMLVLFSALIVLANKYIKKVEEFNERARTELTHAIEIAQRSGEAKLEFISQMSHEIRTPINAILGMNELILRDSDDNVILDYSDSIKKAGNTLLSLVNSVLDFSKINEGNMNIVPIKYEVQDLIDYLSLMTKDRAVKKGLNFVMDIDPTLPSVLYGDDVRIKQIIVNLLTNAVKYTNEGTVTLTMTNQYNDEGFILHVEVEDTGIGILPEDRDKLFQSFKRLDEVRNHNIEGTGLGIPIVSQLLKLMDSRLELITEYGVGSTFWFDLKQDVIDYTSISEKKDVKRPEKGNEVFVYAPSCSILVVDDNDINLQVIKGIARRNGLKVSTADGGRDALELLKHNKYHIIFLDIMMPDIDGVETLNEIKRHGLCTKDTKIIALTADAVNGAREQYMNKGFDDFLAKPIEIDYFESILSVHLPTDLVEYVTEVPDFTNLEKDKKDNLNKEKKTVKEDQAVYLDKNEENEENEEVLLDKEIGLKYCGGKEEFYVLVLKKFLDNKFNENLATSLEDEDFKQYQIDVHALKSTSLSIGATKLSELAKSLEMACKESNYDYVKDNHDSLVKMHNKVLDYVRKMVH